MWYFRRAKKRFLHKIIKGVEIANGRKRDAQGSLR